MTWDIGDDLAVGNTSRDGVLIGAAVSRVRDGWRVQMIRREADAQAMRLHTSEDHETMEAAMQKAEDVAREAFAAETQAAHTEAVTT